MSKEKITSIAVAEASFRSSLGQLKGSFLTQPEVIPVDRIGIMAVPDTKWSAVVDKIESPFATDYDQEEYVNNPALAMMGLFELRMMLNAFNVPANKQTDYVGQPLAESRFLVAGTGPGREMVALASLGGTVNGIDATEQYVKIAAKKLELAQTQLNRKFDVALDQCPAEKFPYPENFFDGITSLFGVLNHVENWEEVVYKMANSLKIDGSLVISMYGSNDALVFDQMRKGNIPYAPSIFQRRAQGGILLGESDEVLPASFPTPNEIKKALELSGLEVKKTEGFLRIAALFPRNATPENLSAFKKLAFSIDSKSREMLTASDPESLLLSACLYDRLNQKNSNDFAYVGFTATRKE